MKKLNLSVVIALLALSMAAIGCNKVSEEVVLAKVNRSNITTADLKKQMEELSPQMQLAVTTDPKARKEFLEDLIGIEVVLQEAKRQGLDKDAEYKKKQDALKKELERRIQEEAKNELFNTLLKKELLGKIKPPTDEEVKEYYTKNRAEIKKATGKDMTQKQAEEKGLKNYIYQKKQRDAYLEYANGLKAKAKITMDEKALETAVAALSQAPASTLQLQQPTVVPAAKEEKKDEKKKEEKSK